MLPVAHGLIGTSIVAAAVPSPSFTRDWKKLLIGFSLANVPDLDFFFVWILGYGYEWHRAFTHSVVFAAAVGLLASLFSGALRVREFLIYSAATLSHTVLDYLTTTGAPGVEVLWPLFNYRFKLGVTTLFEVVGEHPAISGAAADYLKLGLLELIIFLPVLLAVMLVKRRTPARALNSEGNRD